MKQAVALVLSGGAARGLAHIGVIEELERQDFEIKSIAGTSMGALIAAMYAMGTLDKYKKWILSLDKKDVFNLIDFTFSSQGLIKGDKVFNTLKSFIPDKNIEELNIPFAAIATDLTKEREIVMTSGSVFDAVRASISIPTIFTPVTKDDMLLVDGGVLNPIPVNRVQRTENDMLIAVNLYANIPFEQAVPKTKKQIKSAKTYEKNIKAFKKNLKQILPKHEHKLGFFKLIDAATDAMVHKIAQMSLDMYHPDITIEISKKIGANFDFYRAKEFIKIGKQAAQKAIADYDISMIEKHKKNLI